MEAKIKNLDDLQKERARLKESMSETMMTIKADFQHLKSRFNPAKKIISMITSHDQGLIYNGIKGIIESVTYNKLLKSLPWPIRLASTYVLKNVVVNLIYKNRTVIIEKARGAIQVVKGFFSKKPMLQLSR